VVHCESDMNNLLISHLFFAAQKVFVLFTPSTIISHFVALLQYRKIPSFTIISKWNRTVISNDTRGLYHITYYGHN
jgi:hypothetical protein